MQGERVGTKLAARAKRSYAGLMSWLGGMSPLSYSGHRFPRDIIQRAVWRYLRFTLSFRDVEELLAERGIVVTYESIRRWVLTFGPGVSAGDSGPDAHDRMDDGTSA